MTTARKIVASHRGRKCRTPGCKRPLSIYNHGIHCHIHLEKEAAKQRFTVPEK